jgi:hypothetical protein
MELKRYVLLENKEIIDTKDNLLQKRDSHFLSEKGYQRYYGYFTSLPRKNAKYHTLHFANGGRNETELAKYLGKVLKSSDNILDLVEVGDLVEYHVFKEEYRTFKVDKVQEGVMLSYNDYCRFEDITVIYKRQANGDYKRYEMEEK